MRAPAAKLAEPRTELPSPVAKDAQLSLSCIYSMSRDTPDGSAPQGIETPGITHSAGSWIRPSARPLPTTLGAPSLPSSTPRKSGVSKGTAAPDGNNWRHSEAIRNRFRRAEEKAEVRKGLANAVSFEGDSLRDVQRPVATNLQQRI